MIKLINETQEKKLNKKNIVVILSKFGIILNNNTKKKIMYTWIKKINKIKVS